MRIYVQRHTPQKGMSLILDTVSQMRGRATQLDTSQLGEVTNAMSHVTATLCSQPPSSTPALFPAGPASHTPYRQIQISRHRTNTTQRQRLRTDTDVLSLMPAFTTSPDVSNPAPLFATQHQRVWPNASVSSLMLASTTQHRHFEPNASVYDQHRPP